MSSSAVGAVLLVLAGVLLGAYVAFRFLRVGMAVVLEDIDAELYARALAAGYPAAVARTATDGVLACAKARTLRRRGRCVEGRHHA